VGETFNHSRPIRGGDTRKIKKKKQALRMARVNSKEPSQVGRNEKENAARGHNDSLTRTKERNGEAQQKSFPEKDQ